ncbi:MAG: transcriptional repressor [Actinomycetota bacterium]
MSSKAATSKVVERSTRQRAAILAAMEGIDEFKSAQEIYVLLTNKKVDVGMATVYRTLQKMAEREDVDAILNEDGETLYRNCGQSEGHHHI